MTEKVEVAEEFRACFEGLEDPRMDRKKLYPLEEILFVVLCGAIYGAESWRDLVMLGEEKLDFMREHFSFKQGIPCKNTFARVMSALNPEAFRGCFMKWMERFQKTLGEVIAIDGKTLRGSGDEAKGQKAMHMVSAFGASARLVLAQQKGDEKSNEITAIPKLLDLFDIKGQTVTIDAAGCQKAIAEKIQTKEADYVLALKGNQGRLNEDVRLFLETEVTKPRSSVIASVYEDVDKGHGRIETRKCVVSDQIDWLEQKAEWAGLKTVAMIEKPVRRREKPVQSAASSSVAYLPMLSKLRTQYDPIGLSRTHCIGR